MTALYQAVLLAVKMKIQGYRGTAFISLSKCDIEFESVSMTIQVLWGDV